MFKYLAGHFSKGLLFVKNNPQIIYTIFLVVFIPIAFIASGQKFLSVAKENQERLEKERVGVMQDIFIELAALKMDDPASLQSIIERLKDQNKESISEFKVVVFEGGQQKVIASIDKGEIGTADEENAFFYREAGARADVSKIFPVSLYGERHWNVVRAIPGGETGAVLGVVFIDISMRAIDEVAAQNIKSAYIFLFFVVLAISFLLLRQAKIIDYTVLYRKLKEVDQMKDDFISMAAHELRTPLTVVKGHAEMLAKSSNLKEEDREDVSRITVSINQLNTFIGDMLDVIRLGQGKMSFDRQNTDISPILEEVVGSFAVVARQKGLEISYEKKDIPKVFVDAEKLRQVLVNIIGNSMKYTSQGSVKVFAEVSRDTVFIRVRDTGIGISAEDQQKLFGKFFRVKSKETEDIQGTGLGLWIAAQIISNMDGKISVESIKGKGTDFILSFPVAR
ncbi:MAG: ATP-binding protein [Patescibacteria group bacterium]